ncbi:MAG: glycoside hydrolase family 16 protein, partial [Clostridia bacterium]|nr:glycoside hydrolase family 16 protein [Clostridia bacterium]
MKHKKLLAFSLLGAAILAGVGTLVACSATKDTVIDTKTTTETEVETTTQPPAAVLLFEDNFDGDKLDKKKWGLVPEWKRQGELDIWDDDMTSLDGNGHLILRAEWDAANHRVRSGGVRTLGKFAGSYGYYEASIRFPVAPGTWGAFWLMCGDVGGRKGVEIDVIESIFNERGECSHALHWDGYGEFHKSANSGGLTGHGIYDGNFHTFGVERTPDGYVFYIDGKETWRAGANVCKPEPQDGYMKLTVEAADWAGAGTKTSIDGLPADMVVDWVRA